MPPNDFIPVIENTPVSGLLTYWVVDTVAVDLGDWLRAHPDAHVGINVPPEILGRGGLIYAAYKANLIGIRRQVVVDVTERGIPDKGTARHVRARRDDRHGQRRHRERQPAGALARVPVDVIKLDVGFTQHICRCEDDVGLQQLRALIRAGRHLVVAEGVETREQAQLLREAGVQLAQGWYFSRSLPPNAFHTGTRSATPIRRSRRRRLDGLAR